MTVLAFMGLSLLVALAIGLPISISLGGLGLAWIVALNPKLIVGAAYATWNTASNDVLIAIPLFLLMGEVLQRADVAGRFYRGVAVWLRRLPGGLLHANIASSALFAAVSGSSIATAATIGAPAIPNLRKRGYDAKLTYGSLAAGGTLGILIPPSIPMIVYSALTDTSVGKLLMAGLIPGLLLAFIFSAYILVRAIRNPSLAPADDRNAVDAVSRAQSIVLMLPLFIVMLVVLAGIYLGWTTTTEAAALGVMLAMAAAWQRGRLGLTMMRECLFRTVRFTSMIMLIITGANIFSFAIFSWGVTREVASYISHLDVMPFLVLLIIMAAYFILGMFMDSISIMVLTMAIIFPTVKQLGYDPIWFGVLVVVLLEIGLITPPVGMNLFTIQSLDPKNISLAAVAQGSIPFVFLMFVLIGLIVVFPQIALWLPSRM